VQSTPGILLTFGAIACAIAFVAALCESSHLSGGAIRGFVVGVIFLLRAGFRLMGE